MKESKIRLGLETFFRRMYKYCFMSEEKKVGQKVDVLVQLISCRNVLQLPFCFSHFPSLSLFTAQENRIIFA